MSNKNEPALPTFPSAERDSVLHIVSQPHPKSAEEYTLPSLSNLKHALDQHAIVSIANAAGDIISVNEKFCEITGYPQQEILGQNHRLLKSSHHSEEFFHDMWNTISTGRSWQGEIKNRKKNGEYYWVASTIVPLLDENGLPHQYISIRTDITEQKKLQESLALSEERYRTLLAQVPVGVFELDAARACYYVNDRWCSITGLSAQESKGEGWLGAVHVQDRLRFAEDWSTALNCGQEFQCECRFGPDAQAPRWVSVVARKLTDHAGNVTGYLGSATDITSIKKSEAELLLAKMTAESASRAKSEFLSRMSHELRTPLNAIIGFSQLLEADTAEPLTSNQAEANQHVLSAGRHLLGLISEILDLSRIETGSLDVHEENCSIHLMLQETLTMMSLQAEKSRVRLTLEAGVDCLVRTDPRRFMQVMLNLLSNAIKYNREQGYVHIAWEPRANDMLRISVVDNGFGIPADQIEHIFEPFNRLAYENSDIEGTGIGLAIASRLMMMLHGSIGVQSEPGQGSTFWIDMPLGQPSPTREDTP